LLIDDDPAALDILDILFETQGFKVFRHSSAEAALETMNETQPDVVVIDLTLPQMSGTECVRRMRARGISVPVVAFTAIDDPEELRQAQLAGCTQVVTKPCRSKDLVNHIRAVVGSAPAQ
jgi:DNA-binding response OmpR family regulator